MSVTPGPWAMPSSIRNGRSAAVPGSNTVSMWPMSRTRGPSDRPVERADDRVRRSGPPGRAGRRRRRRARSRNAGDPAADLVDAGRRVRPAVDVDEPLRGRRGSPAGRPRSRPRRASSSRVGRRSSRVGLGTRSTSARPVYASRPRLLSCRDRATGRDPPARGPQRLPARAGGQARGRRRPAPDVVRPARSGPPRARPPGRPRPAARLARRRRRGRRLGPPAARRPRRGSDRPGRPSLVRPRPLDRHLPVDRRGAGPAR